MSIQFDIAKQIIAETCPNLPISMIRAPFNVLSSSSVYTVSIAIMLQICL